MGFHLILYPLAGLFAATHALQSTYQHLRTAGTTLGGPSSVRFDEFNAVIGVDKKYALAERFGAV
jgi:methylisocitrate lyase